MVRGVEDREKAVVLAGHSVNQQVSAEFHATECASAHEDDSDSTGGIGKGEFKTGDLFRPGLNPKRFHSARNLDVLAPDDVADRQYSSKGATTELIECSAGLGETFGL